MKTALQKMRKAAGFKSAKAFAEHIGLNATTYTQYEQGVRSFTLERAWEFADALDCTLDELAGREWPVEQAPAVSRDESLLLTDYRTCTPNRKRMLASTARDFAVASEKSAAGSVCYEEQDAEELSA